MKKTIRLLRADEIECRVSTISEKGVSLLLYKDGRTDMNILDEVFTISGWKRTHERIGDALFCTVAVWDDEKKQWVEKSDVGSPTYAESRKGEASDSFKRACVNIGIGRELYTAPFIWIPAEKLTIEEYKGKLVIKDRLHVSDIQYDEKNTISGVEIMNDKGAVVFTYNNRKKVTESSKSTLSVEQRRALLKEMLRTGVEEESICDRYGIKELKSMSVDTYKRVMHALEKTADLAA